MPFIAALLITYMNPKYMTPLIEDPLGQLILMGGLLMWAFGFVWIRSLVKVEY